MSRVKARLKFMVDDIGAEGMLERVEAKLGRTLERFELPPITAQPSAHIGVHAQKQDGLSYIGVPVQLGLSSGDQLIAVADLVESFGGDIRLTRQQNLIVTGVSDVEATLGQLEELGLPLTTNEIWANSIACTGEPHCNFSVGETKDRLRELLEHLETTFGDEIAELRLHLDGCPHACAQHWVGDLGFQATTGKDADGNRISAYDIFVRGALGPEPRDRRLALPPRRERPDRARGRRADPRLARRPRRRRDLHGVPAPPIRRRARRTRRARARAQARTRGGRSMSTFELLDELEAGELSIEYEGEEPQALLEWAIDEFSPRLAISTAFQADDVALIDMAYKIDPDVRIFTVDTGRLPRETHELIERCARSTTA